MLLCFKNCLFSPRVHVALLEKMNVLQRGVWPLIDEEDIIEIEDYGYWVKRYQQGYGYWLSAKLTITSRMCLIPVQDEIASFLETALLVPPQITSSLDFWSLTVKHNQTHGLFNDSFWGERINNLVAFECLEDKYGTSAELRGLIDPWSVFNCPLAESTDRKWTKVVIV